MLFLGPEYWRDGRDERSEKGLVSGEDLRKAASVESELLPLNRKCLDLKALRLLIATLEAVPTAVMITTAEGRIVWVNAGFEALTGYTREEVLGRSPKILRGGVQDEAFYKELWTTIRSGKPWCGELVNRRKDASLYRERQWITPVIDGDVITHFVAVKEPVDGGDLTHTSPAHGVPHRINDLLFTSAGTSSTSPGSLHSRSLTLSSALFDRSLEISKALSDGRFLLHFQPIVDMSSSRVQFAEVLLRMRGPDGQLLLPGEFLPVCEIFGMMPRVDLWVLEQALELLVRHPRLKLFVNVSGQTVGQGGLVELVQRHAQEHGSLNRRLVLEMTETVALVNLREAREWMERLRAMGCSFSVDDFSQGQFSWSHLRDLPIDYVKLDGSLIHYCAEKDRFADVLKGVSMVVQGLGKQAIAEWVEDARVARRLRECGIRLGQGFLWGKPGACLPKELCPEP